MQAFFYRLQSIDGGTTCMIEINQSMNQSMHEMTSIRSIESIRSIKGKFEREGLHDGHGASARRKSLVMCNDLDVPVK